MTRLLFIGDIVGKPGRELVRRGLATLVRHHDIDFVIANGENAAAGFGLTPELADAFATVVGGTHTHVQTADDRVLPRGTAYITDVGMTGPHDGVIGMDRAAIIARFLSALPQRFETATENPRLNGVIVDADEATGK